MKTTQDINWRRGKETRKIKRNVSYRKTTMWAKVIKYLNGRKFYERLKAHKALKVNPKIYNMGTIVDGYRSVLTRAGFLKEIKPGMYERIKEIPPLLTLKAAKEMYSPFDVGPTIVVKTYGRTITERQVKNFDEVVKKFKIFILVQQHSEIEKGITITEPVCKEGYILYGYTVKKVKGSHYIWLKEIVDSSD